MVLLWFPPGVGRRAGRLFYCGFRIAECGLEDSATLINPQSEIRIPQSVSPHLDRKSTRLNSSHDQISYAVFCLKKNNNGPPLVFTTPSAVVIPVGATKTRIFISPGGTPETL